ncbi:MULTISPECIES: aldo/keto reductase [Salinivibrio]|uniref:2,5-diketo-D-gluconic acid reductase n=1 Tax=Salinivibrio siamensis TaxID=414286 RepID=A0ABX3KE32_9GAMM|nr:MULTISPECIES: aldo/keto reductase [Salinivibrio]KKA46160.1 2,5-diketo-D-gluconic acid reductase [Salinivibrio sp. KP-1]OOE67158.1 2,5-diketo-D-gluconic acid reductase [Salinivibrio sp. IB868]OOE77291.1 2,5-diketo-D-gluconic acid reductase [Salinivibrio sp. IB870]OOE81651.1 2,5-diketo-D-gluconic acid reductase [Salinivibrio sp. ML198]OOE84666.1 2,5-diketo-D-gluconic acid reductase [Salinivibrio sp. PR6]
MILEETYSLTNGIAIPKLALGTWMIEGESATNAVTSAIELGYRHIDTAQDYGNEAEVADGVRASSVEREQIFVTSKLAARHKTYEDAAAAIDESLEKMGLDYLDLMIIHSPQPWDHFGTEDRFAKGNQEAWRALEDAYNAGKLKAIGLSNFQEADIDNIVQHSRVAPMVHQVLAHVTNVPTALIEYSRNKGMLVEAYSPVGHGELFKNEAIIKMAERYQVSVPQLCIRYDLQLGLLPLPKTAKPAHMANNADVDFVISEADMQSLSALEPIRDYGNASQFPVFQQVDG